MKPLKLQATLIAYRKQQHWTQTDLAEKIFLSRQTISNW
ncbi:helix-turn-helix transcriptional regulator [Levilactobacillus cerevisiae]|nr:helix-turn-helix transcriptional regulator [Levilactobacillus cerevisiae]